jgi:hypothetical protein
VHLLQHRGFPHRGNGVCLLTTIEVLAEENAGWVDRGVDGGRLLRAASVAFDDDVVEHRAGAVEVEALEHHVHLHQHRSLLRPLRHHAHRLCAGGHGCACVSVVSPERDMSAVPEMSPTGKTYIT